MNNIQELREAWQVLSGDNGIKDFLHEYNQQRQEIERLSEELAMTKAQLEQNQALKLENTLESALIEFATAHEEADTLMSAKKRQDMSAALTRITAATKGLLDAWKNQGSA